MTRLSIALLGALMLALMVAPGANAAGSHPYRTVAQAQREAGKRVDTGTYQCAGQHGRRADALWTSFVCLIDDWDHGAYALQLQTRPHGGWSARVLD